MTKKIILTAMIVSCVFLNGCIFEEKIIRGKARGNEAETVYAVQKISDLGTVETVAVLCSDNAVLAGLRLSDRERGGETCEQALKILKKQFPRVRTYIVGADETWAEDVIELSLYAEGGMDRKILEKRFEFLVNEKLKKAKK